VKKEEVRQRIEEVGIVAAIRVSSRENALFAAEAVHGGGIPIIEIALTVPEATEVISHLVRQNPKLVVGAGSVLNPQMAQASLDAGAQFLTSDGLHLPLLEFAARKGVVVFPGALTPTEIITAWEFGCDFVKVAPCAHVGGESYIRSIHKMFPHIPLIAAGGVNQLTALNFVLAGAMGLGVGRDLMPSEAIRMRQTDRIQELARRFISFVANGRIQAAARSDPNYPRVG
jgi:2-dehydro-3-deoxyphosphogluconate aldolase / (4S)-4-hydroxy-2-oxoglutarate aldolase